MLGIAKLADARSNELQASALSGGNAELPCMDKTLCAIVPICRRGQRSLEFPQ
jgi:hypothetical protein